MTFARCALLAAAIAPRPLIAAPVEPIPPPCPSPKTDGAFSAPAS
jgi:hypothetical protein